MVRPPSATWAPRSPVPIPSRRNADKDNDNMQDPGEPFDTAAQDLDPPAEHSSVQDHAGGQITADNGDKATFGGTRRSQTPGAQGA